jgi:hypothetical protein
MKPDLTYEIVRNFDALPDDSVVQTKITSVITGLSDRTIRYHPKLKRIQISRGRVGQRVGDIRALLRGEDTAA